MIGGVVVTADGGSVREGTGVLPIYIIYGAMVVRTYGGMVLEGIGVLVPVVGLFVAMAAGGSVVADEVVVRSACHHHRVGSLFLVTIPSEVALVVAVGFHAVVVGRGVA